MNKLSNKDRSKLFDMFRNLLSVVEAELKVSVEPVETESKLEQAKQQLETKEVHDRLLSVSDFLFNLRQELDELERDRCQLETRFAEVISGARELQEQLEDLIDTL
jgi:uncharacterized protein involved in exopolysaccharide biosynthesis